MGQTQLCEECRQAGIQGSELDEDLRAAVLAAITPQSSASIAEHLDHFLTLLYFAASLAARPFDENGNSSIIEIGKFLDLAADAYANNKREDAKRARSRRTNRTHLSKRAR